MSEKNAWKRVAAIAYDLYFHMAGSMDSKIYKHGIELESLAKDALSHPIAPGAREEEIQELKRQNEAYRNEIGVLRKRLYGEFAR